MDVRDFRIMIRKHAPWLLGWIASRAGQFKMPRETSDAFEALVAVKIESIREILWKDLRMDEETYPSNMPVEGHVGKYITTSRYYTVVWRKNDEEKVLYTGTEKLAGLCVDKLLRLVLSECGADDTPWVTAVVETIYTINTASEKSPQHSFVIYPCEERAFMEWVDRNKDGINRVLAQRQLTLSGYTVVAQSN